MLALWFIMRLLYAFKKALYLPSDNIKQPLRCIHMRRSLLISNMIHGTTENCASTLRQGLKWSRSGRSRWAKQRWCIYITKTGLSLRATFIRNVNKRQCIIVLPSFSQLLNVSLVYHDRWSQSCWHQTAFRLTSMFQDTSCILVHFVCFSNYKNHWLIKVRIAPHAIDAVPPAGLLLNYEVLWLASSFLCLPSLVSVAPLPLFLLWGLIHSNKSQRPTSGHLGALCLLTLRTYNIF